MNLHANYVAHHRGVLHRVDPKFRRHTARYENPFGNHLKSLIRSLCETILQWMCYVGCTESYTVVRAEFFENALDITTSIAVDTPHSDQHTFSVLHFCRIELMRYPPSDPLRLKLATFCRRHLLSYCRRRKPSRIELLHRSLPDKLSDPLPRTSVSSSEVQM